MRVALALLTTLVACGGSAGMATANNVLTADEQAAGWVLLFDGVSTAGWRGYGRDDFPTGGWVVEGGELVGQSTSGDMDGGDIITVAEYADFELVFDFKVGPEGNSGVFYRVKEHDGVGLFQVAAEYQVLDDPAYIAMGTMDMNTHLTGDNYDLHATAEKTMNPTGEWNTGRIVVEGDHVEHWLNGRMTVEFDMYTDEWEALVAASKFGVEEYYSRAPTGSIGLQDHGTPVWYRNMKIRPSSGGG
jgi:alpha-3'-ketoglucosidase